MLEQLIDWYQYRFKDPNLGVLFLLLISAFLVFYFFGDILAPLFIALILSYLLDWPINWLMRYRINRNVAIVIVMSIFGAITAFTLVGLLPTIFKQGAGLIHDLPNIFNRLQGHLLTLPLLYPDTLDANTLTNLMENARNYVVGNGGFLLSKSFSSLLNIAAVMVYAILVPLMMVFMLKDKKYLVRSLVKYLPENRKLANQVWVEMNAQIINYIRGKIIEILIVGISTYCAFYFMGMRYSALLAVLVGISVLVPYIGAVIVTIPVAIVAFVQWGPSADFVYLMLAYSIIQVIDGNLIVPLLFSEAVNLHPVVIIVAVLIFGGLWGFWGVFFAIPLATLVKAVLNAWPGRAQLNQADNKSAAAV